MKRRVLTLLAAISLAALVLGGCANKEVVKSEEAVVPKAAESSVAAPAKAEAKAESAKPVETAASLDPTGAKQAAKAAAPVADSSLETVYFYFDKSDLRQDARNVLSKNAEVLLKAKPNAKIQIEGHCDERGSSEYNLALGDRRAKSSLQYLITLGVKADRLSTISYGKEKPAVQGNDEAAWAKNRRAEFVAK
ncbi:MAG: peptidoglycan-associated lipoprotein Pal [Deltaproteobacteria bacterium]|nr:peptidoglycan-associated lipoprotein Pal [Deltaproteobacteria bacterium]